MKKKWVIAVMAFCAGASISLCQDEDDLRILSLSHVPKTMQSILDSTGKSNLSESEKGLIKLQLFIIRDRLFEAQQSAIERARAAVELAEKNVDLGRELAGQPPLTPSEKRARDKEFDAKLLSSVLKNIPQPDKYQIDPPYKTEELKLRNGKAYKKVVISEATPKSIHIKHQGGFARVESDQIPFGLRNILYPVTVPPKDDFDLAKALKKSTENLMEVRERLEESEEKLREAAEYRAKHLTGKVDRLVYKTGEIEPSPSIIRVFASTAVIDRPGEGWVLIDGSLLSDESQIALGFK